MFGAEPDTAADIDGDAQVEITGNAQKGAGNVAGAVAEGQLAGVENGFGFCD